MCNIITDKFIVINIYERPMRNFGEVKYGYFEKKLAGPQYNFICKHGSYNAKDVIWGLNFPGED